jgi:ABC-2 type transport system permease protein
MFKNGLRSNRGLFELGARTFAYLIYGVMGLGMGVGVGVGAYFLVARGEMKYFPVLMWVVFLVWQLVPVAMASFQEQYDISGLLRFPVSFWSFYLLFLVFGLVEISTIIGGLCCFGIWAGVTVAAPGLSGWAALALVFYATFNVLLVRAIFAWIDRWLAQRRTREIVGALFLVAVLCVQLLNPALRQRRHVGSSRGEEQAESDRRVGNALMPWLQRADAVQRWLPPGLAAESVRWASKDFPEPAIESLVLLGFCTVGVGGALALRLKSEYRGESLGEAPSRKKTDARESGWQLGGSGPLAAVVVKELRALMRTLPLLWAAGAPLILVLVFSGVFVRGGSDGHVFTLALPVCMVYAQLGFTQLFYNNLGAEGPGIQLIFLSPTPIRTVMLGKNLFHAMLFAVIAVLAGVLAGVRLGVPSGAVIAATAGWIVFALPCNLTAGNVFSINMAYRVNPGRISRQKGSQANALLSMVVQIGVIAVGAAVFALSWYLGNFWLAVPVFLLFSAVAFWFWLRGLGNTGAMANQRRDTLIATLAKTE